MRNVVLVVLDTVRKDYFDEYAPRLQELSDVSFEECRAAASWTVPSHASMMTGKLPHQHGIHTHNRDFSGLEVEDTFMSDLPGHRKIGASANYYMSPTFGFDGLFDRFSEISPHRRYPEGMDVIEYLHGTSKTGLSLYLYLLKKAVSHDKTIKSLANGGLLRLQRELSEAPLPNIFDDGAKIVSEQALGLIDETAEPFFLFTNFMEAHPPLQHTLGYDKSIHGVSNKWTSHEFDYWDVNKEGKLEENKENIENFRGIYSAAIDYLDRKVSTLVEEIQKTTDEDTTIIITADHGENLGYPEDNYLFGHMSSMSEGLLHVPLCIINPPEGYHTRETGLFSHLDLGDLIKGLAVGDTPNVFRERIYAEIVGGIKEDADVPLEENEHRYWNRMMRCAYRDNLKFVWDSYGQTTKYEFGKEACWQKKVDEDIDLPSSVKKGFSEGIEDYKNEARLDERPASELDGATQEQLKELGYL